MQGSLNDYPEELPYRILHGMMGNVNHESGPVGIR